MTKIYFDYNKLNDITLPSIITSKNYLEKACRIGNSMDIPGDFKYRSSLNKISSRINDLDKDIRKIIDWLETSKTKYKEIATKNENDCSKLTVSEIERRENFLK